MRITFYALDSKFQKKNLSARDFFYFFLQIRVTFGERIPKRLNTLGLEHVVVDALRFDFSVCGTVLLLCCSAA